MDGIGNILLEIQKLKFKTKNYNFIIIQLKTMPVLPLIKNFKVDFLVLPFKFLISK
jgi:hypothetical protein